MTEMTPDEVSTADTLRHIADDHPCCKGSLLAAVARIEALEEHASVDRSFIEQYRREVAELKARIEGLEKVRLLAISEWSTWKDVLLSNMTEADWQETMNGLRAPATLGAKEKR